MNTVRHCGRGAVQCAPTPSGPDSGVLRLRRAAPGGPVASGWRNGHDKVFISDVLLLLVCMYATVLVARKPLTPVYRIIYLRPVLGPCTAVVWAYVATWRRLSGKNATRNKHHSN